MLASMKTYDHNSDGKRRCAIKALRTAPRKLMTTPRQRFKWLVDFVSLDLSTLRSGDQANVREELNDFLLPLATSIAPGGLHTWVSEEPYPDTYPAAELQALQVEIYEALALAIQSRVDNDVLPWKELPSLLFRAPHVPADKGAPGRHCLSVQGKVRDLVWYLLFQLFATENTAALARCPECDRIFLRQTNQRYCGRTCANRVGQRAWRERHATPVA
jgi:hypothetical protein